MYSKHLKSITASCLLAASATGTVAVQAADPEEILRNNCMACHVPDAAGRYTRIPYQRKTPEGWEMTIRRMQLMHHITISDQDNPITDDLVRQLVKYLADTQGLAPEETAGYRYILERRLNTIEQHADEEFAVICARCHSGARVALQRRTEQEWNYLVHFHLGQFPSSEYSAGGRDRDWFGIAIERTVPWLAEQFPLDSAAWRDWRQQAKPVLAGNWRLIGWSPGRGAFHGRMQAMHTGADQYALTYSGVFEDGEPVFGDGAAMVYTGFEWRASLTVNGRDYNQVLAAAADGSGLSGRMFLAGQEETGIDLHATREDGNSRLLAVIPDHIRAGARATLTLAGTGLNGAIDLGGELTILEVLRRNGNEIVLQVEADADAAPARISVRVGDTGLDDGLSLYRRIGYLAVEPGYAIARIGEVGGIIPPVAAGFQALAYSTGPDGEAHTADDMPIGYVPARWSVRPWDAAAEQAGDVNFAGEMDPATGIFTPAEAGPNPLRPYSTNNVGNLAVVAEAGEGDERVRGEAHLIVTVQRWNNPPIR